MYFIQYPLDPAKVGGSDQKKCDLRHKTNRGNGLLREIKKTSAVSIRGFYIPKNQLS